MIQAHRIERDKAERAKDCWQSDAGKTRSAIASSASGAMSRSEVDPVAHAKQP